MDFDVAWCPACDKQIDPKRIVVNVPVNQPNQPPPAPPSSPKKSKPNIKNKGGLVNGTGRVRANGTIKPTTPPIQQQQPQKSRKRTIIDQGPIPLYCSDECQVMDLAKNGGADPAREDPIVPLPTKHHSSDAFSTAGTNSESDSSASECSSSSPQEYAYPSYRNPSIVKLAAMYNFPPPPPPPPTYDEPTPDLDPPNYTNGIIMAGRLLASLCPPKPPRSQLRYPSNPPQPPKVIPGWNDGTNAWRENLYGFAVPNSGNLPHLHSGTQNRACGLDLTEHPEQRQRSTYPPRRPTSSYHAYSYSAQPTPPNHSASDEMIANFSRAFVRPSPAPSSPSSPTSTSASPPRKERSLVPKGVEGKLLVPDVKMKVRSGSSASLSSASAGRWSVSGDSRRSIRSPLIRSLEMETTIRKKPTTDEDSENDDVTDRPYPKPMRSKRPTENTRSWSYDNVKTYPLMPFPPKKVWTVERHVVDGVEIDVEVQIEIQEERKRLFLFPPTEKPMPAMG